MVVPAVVLVTLTVTCAPFVLVKSSWSQSPTTGVLLASTPR